jgi:Hemolysin coregulated protein Hcp (TssD)
MAQSSFSAKFSAAGSEEFEVIACSYKFHQSIDDKGRPSSLVRGGIIDVTIVSTTDSALIAFMLDPYKKDSGKIVYNRIDQESMLKDIQFEDAYCIEYQENFDARGFMAGELQSGSQAGFTITMRFSANKLTVNGCMLDNKWIQ